MHWFCARQVIVSKWKILILIAMVCIVLRKFLQAPEETNPEEVIHFERALKNFNEENVTDERHHSTREEQHFEPVLNAKMFVKSAIYDPRNKTRRVIRVWAIVAPKAPITYCHIKYQGNETYITAKAFVRVQIDFVPPYCGWLTASILCPVKGDLIPASVSISVSQHSVTNSWIPVRTPTYIPPKPNYGICVKTLEMKGDKDVTNIVEWFEINKLLGVSKIFIYDTQNVSSKLQSVLHSHEDLGLLVMEPWQLPVRPLSPTIYKSPVLTPEIKETRKSPSKVQCVQFHAQYLAHMDCMYRHMDEFSHLAFIDVDEYIIPSGKSLLWKDMFAQIESDPSAKRAASYGFAEACFDLTKPANDTSIVVGNSTANLTTKHYTRLKKFRRKDAVGWHHKSIIKPQFVTDMFVHEANEVLRKYKINLYVNDKIGRLHHYRKPCTTKQSKQKRRKKVVEKMVEDRIMSKYLDKLKEGMVKTLSDVGGADSL